MIPWHIQNITLLVPLILVSLVGAYALFRCRGDKRSFFVLVCFTAFMNVLGYYLGTISEEIAFTGMYLSNFGGGLCVLSTVLFVSEYCEIKLHSVVKVLLCFGTFAYILGVWTLGMSGNYYISIGSNLNVSHPVTYSSGIISALFTLYYVIYIVITFVITLRKIILSQGELRKTLILTLVACLAPVFVSVPERFIEAGNFFSEPVFLTPYAYGISAILFYHAITKYDMLDRSPLSSIQVINTISHAIILLDDKLRYVSANSAGLALFPWLKGYRAYEAIYYSPHWPSELSHTAFERGEFTVDFTLHGAEASRHFSVTAHPFISDVARKKHWSVMVQDVTDKELFIKQLEEAAYTDTLTGLYNRRHFAEIATPYVERTKRAGMSFFIMMADLDFFKQTNDEHGHLAGDAVLRNAAAIMKSSIRAYDIVARWGGEEFIFLITDSHASDVTSLAERIRQSIEQTPCIYNGIELSITISFGIAQSDESNIDMDALIMRADEALYHSKQNGRNRVTMWSHHEL